MQLKSENKLSTIEQLGEPVIQHLRKPTKQYWTIPCVFVCCWFRLASWRMIQIKMFNPFAVRVLINPLPLIINDKKKNMDEREERINVQRMWNVNICNGKNRILFTKKKSEDQGIPNRIALSHFLGHSFWNPMHLLCR